MSSRKLGPEFATTTEMMEAGQCSRRTLWVWVRAELLPKPVKVSNGRKGVFSRWNREDLVTARYIHLQREDGWRLHEIKPKIDRGEHKKKPET